MRRVDTCREEPPPRVVGQAARPSYCAHRSVLCWVSTSPRHSGLAWPLDLGRACGCRLQRRWSGQRWHRALVRREADESKRAPARVDRPPVAVTHTLRPLDDEAFAATLKARLRVISLALGYSADLIKRTHDVSILFVHQVHTVEQARQAAEGGADVISAQGTKAGGRAHAGCPRRQYGHSLHDLH
jgi:hypothetical protein